MNKKIYTYKNKKSLRPEKVMSLEELQSNLFKSVYYFEELLRGERVSIDELFDTGEIYAYEDDSNTRPTRVKISEIIDWPIKMLISYRALHPEQKLWFDTITVDNLVQRDALMTEIEPESWVFVKDSGDGISREYVLTPDKKEWVFAGISGRSKASGKEMLETMYSRLTEGYLYDTFGPEGENKNACDFLYAIFAISTLTARSWENDLGVIRWDNGSAVEDVNGIPEMQGFLTASDIASFSGIREVIINNTGIVGSHPRINTSGGSEVSTTVFNRFRTGITGKLPLLDLSGFSNLNNVFFAMTRITSIPELDYSGIGENATIIDTFFQCIRLERVPDVITFPPGTRVFGVFRNCNLKNFPRLKNVTAATNFEGHRVKTLDLSAVLPEGIENLINFCAYSDITTIEGTIPALDTSMFKNCRRLSAISLDGATPGNSFKTGSNLAALDLCPLDTPSVDNFLKFLYENRFDLSSEAKAKGLIPLGGVEGYHPPSGIYQNAETPSTGNEYLYKLVENPDEEDRKSFIFLDPAITSHDDTLTDIAINVTDLDTTITVTINTLGATFSNSVGTVNWGDGEVELIEAKRGGPFTVSHTYSAPGNYVIKMSDALTSVSARDSFDSIAPAELVTHITISVPNILGWPGLLRGFRNLPNLKEVRSKAGFLIAVGWLRETFRNCPSLEYIDPIYWFNGTLDANNIVRDSPNIKSLRILNAADNLNITNTSLDANALNDLFNGLAVVEPGSATINVSGNPGVGDPGYDPSIATAKGWTVND